MLPSAGDIVWVELDPVKGTEQGGRRPALVLSHSIYHEVSRRAVICPITTNMRPWPFSVPLPSGLITRGVVLVDQIRTIDRPARIFGIVERVQTDFMAEILGRLASLLGLEAAPSIAGPDRP